ncbi:unnamed protein product [Lasius platythorax]|uniref:Uncharacterized protein n=1 Tax=Lasius platythorax TaxID=488582 RepID=A0AAV2NZK0_9HYME
MRQRRVTDVATPLQIQQRSECDLPILITMRLPSISPRTISGALAFVCLVSELQTLYLSPSSPFTAVIINYSERPFKSCWSRRDVIIANSLIMAQNLCTLWQTYIPRRH